MSSRDCSPPACHSIQGLKRIAQPKDRACMTTAVSSSACRSALPGTSHRKPRQRSTAKNRTPLRTYHSNHLSLAGPRMPKLMSEF